MSMTEEDRAHIRARVDAELSMALHSPLWAALLDMLADEWDWHEAGIEASRDELHTRAFALAVRDLGVDEPTKGDGQCTGG